MRPRSIILFEWLFLLFVVIDIAGGLFNEQVLAITFGLGAGYVALLTMVELVIDLIFWYFLARRGSNSVRWIWTVITVLSVSSRILTVIGPVAPGGVLMVAITILEVLLDLAATAMLFFPGANAWFAGKRHSSYVATFE